MRKAFHSSGNASHLYGEDVVCLILKLEQIFSAHILPAAVASCSWAQLL